MCCPGGVKSGERQPRLSKTGIKHHERMMIDWLKIVKNEQFPKQQGVHAYSPPHVHSTLTKLTIPIKTRLARTK